MPADFENTFSKSWTISMLPSDYKDLDELGVEISGKANLVKGEEAEISSAIAIIILLFICIPLFYISSFIEFFFAK